MRIVDRLEDLSAVNERQVDAVIWRRHVPQNYLSALASLPDGEAVGARFVSRLDAVGEGVIAQLREWDLPLEAAHHWLAGDIETLACQFAQLLACARVIVRIEVVRDDACRKFHRDAMPARVICTYSGPGTEFGVAEDDGEPRNVQSAPTAMPILLKGKLWPGGAAPSIVHRSPPIEGTGITRLVVVIDAAPSGIA